MASGPITLAVCPVCGNRDMGAGVGLPCHAPAPPSAATRFGGEISTADGVCHGVLEPVEYVPRELAGQAKARATIELAELARATIELAELVAHADRLADCLEALVRGKKPHTRWLDEGLDALTAYRDATASDSSASDEAPKTEVRP